MTTAGSTPVYLTGWLMNRTEEKPTFITLASGTKAQCDAYWAKRAEENAAAGHVVPVGADVIERVDLLNVAALVSSPEELERAALTDPAVHALIHHGYQSALARVEHDQDRIDKITEWANTQWHGVAPADVFPGLRELIDSRLARDIETAPPEGASDV